MYKNKDYTLKVSVDIEIPYYRSDRYLKAVEISVGKNNIDSHLQSLTEELLEIKRSYYDNKHTTMMMLKGENTDIEVSKLQMKYLKTHLKPFRSVKSNNLADIAVLKTIYNNAAQYYIEKGVIKYPLTGV